MTCSFDIYGLHAGLAAATGVAFTMWALWSGRFHPVGLRHAKAAPAGALRGLAVLRQSAEAYVVLMRQARMRMERGRDATDILERAIGLVRARRAFIIAVTIVLWSTTMLAAHQFLGDNARCLRMIAGQEPVAIEQLVGHPAPVQDVVHPRRDAFAVGRERARTLGPGIYSVSGFGAKTLRRLPSMPANRREVAHGPA